MLTSLLIVDSQRMVREGLREALAKHPEFKVVGEAGDGPRAVEVARETQPDVAVVESDLPGLSGIEAVRRIRRETPGTRCIVLSTRQNPGQVHEALLAGATGFVPKDSAMKDLVEAICTVRTGQSYLAPGIADCLVSAITSRGEGSSVSATELTGRQREVLRLIAEGLSGKEIASRLGISPKTAQAHRGNLMQKLGVHKASGLVRYAIRNGIVTA